MIAEDVCKKIVPKERSPQYRAAKPAVVGSFENNVGHFFTVSPLRCVSAGGQGPLNPPLQTPGRTQSNASGSAYAHCRKARRSGHLPLVQFSGCY